MILTGQSGPVEGPVRYNRDAAGFLTTIREWMGLEEDLRTLADGLTVPYEIAQVSGPIYRLNATYAGRLVGGFLSTSPEDQVVTVWNLRVQQRNEDVLQLPKVRVEIEKITDVRMRGRFLADVRAMAAGEVFVYDLDSSGNSTIRPLTLENSLKAVASFNVDGDIIDGLIGYLARGLESYRVDGFVLSKKRVGPAAATNLLPTFDLANRPVSTAELLASEPTIPNAIRAPIASELASWFWMRNADELNQLDSDRIEINSQWTAGISFDRFIYDP